MWYEHLIEHVQYLYLWKLNKYESIKEQKCISFYNTYWWTQLWIMAKTQFTLENGKNFVFHTWLYIDCVEHLETMTNAQCDFMLFSRIKTHTSQAFQSSVSIWNRISTDCDTNLKKTTTTWPQNHLAALRSPNVQLMRVAISECNALDSGSGRVNEIDKMCSSKMYFTFVKLMVVIRRMFTPQSSQQANSMWFNFIYGCSCSTKNPRTHTQCSWKYYHMCKVSHDGSMWPKTRIQLKWLFAKNDEAWAPTDRPTA